VDNGQGFGATPFSAVNRDACLRTDENLNIQCSAKLNQEKITSDFELYCKGTQSCIFDLTDPNILGSIDL
jgi:hypothetical protein